MMARGWRIGVMVSTLVVSGTARAQLTDQCTVSVLNRTAPVASDGTWVVPGVPAGTGLIRARATCVGNGVTRSGASDWFTLTANEILSITDIRFDAPAPIVGRLTLQAPVTTLTAAGQTVQLTAIAAYPDGTSADVTAAITGTAYTSSSSEVASVNADGVVTAQRSGAVLITAANEGAIAVVRLQVVTSGDSDGDGMPDDWEVRYGFDAANPADAYDDPDVDGLTNLQELLLGTDPTNRDSDGDALLDGEEVDDHHTNPLLRDTDGDQVGDGLEVLAGSNPLDPLSINLRGILTGLAVAPSQFTITFNTVLGEASRQLRVAATLLDGSTIDATSRVYGTAYSSSDLAIASFGAEDGRVFAGSTGTATVHALNNGFDVTAGVTVETLSPVALASLPIDGIPRTLRTEGDLLLVAAAKNRDGAGGGLYVIDVSVPESPRLESHLPLLAADDVLVDGALVYVTAATTPCASTTSATCELLTVDVADPAAPRVIGSTPINGEARGMARTANALYVVSSSGLRAYDISIPAQPMLTGVFSIQSDSRRAVVAGDRLFVAGSLTDLRIFDLANPLAPSLAAQVPGWAVAAPARGRRAYRAYAGPSPAITVLDTTLADNPVVVGTSQGFHFLKDLVLEDRFAVAADTYYLNAVPIFDVGTDTPALAGIIPFAGTVESYSVAARAGLAFLGASDWQMTAGRIFIGRYLRLVDDAGIAPTVSITTPAADSSVPERQWVVAEIAAGDDVAVRSVELFRDGVSVGKAYASPYLLRFQVPMADHVTLTAAAEDFAGNRTSSEPLEARSGAQ